MQLFNQMIQYGGSNNIPGQQSAAGTTALGQGQSATGQALSGLGSYNPFATNNVNADIAGGNAYAAGANIPAQVQAAMFPAVQTANEITLPGIGSAANASGNANSSRTAIAQGLVGQGLAENAQNIAANLEGNYYNTGAGLAANANTANNANALSAYGALGQLGGANSQLGLGALSSALGNQTNLFNLGSEGGAGLQQANQLPLTNQQQAWQFGQNSPFAALNNEYNIIGSNNWGNEGTYNGTSTTTTTPSLASTLGGLLGAGSSLFGGGGMFGSMGAFGNLFGSSGVGSSGGYGAYAPAMASMGAGISPSGSVFYY